MYCILLLYGDKEVLVYNVTFQLKLSFSTRRALNPGSTAWNPSTQSSPSLCSGQQPTRQATAQQTRIFFPSRILIFSIPDPGSASKNVSIWTQKIVPKLSEIWSGLFNPGSGSRIQILIFYLSRIQGSKRHRIPDPDPQHCPYYMISKWLSPRVLESLAREIAPEQKVSSQLLHAKFFFRARAHLWFLRNVWIRTQKSCLPSCLTKTLSECKKFFQQGRIKSLKKGTIRRTTTKYIKSWLVFIIKVDLQIQNEFFLTLAKM